MGSEFGYMHMLILLLRLFTVSSGDVFVHVREHIAS